MARILVTGGAGFIGSALVKTLLDQGHQIRVFDDLSRGSLGGLPREGNIEVVGGSVNAREAVNAAVEGVDEVWHLAAINGTKNFYERPFEVLSTGLAGIQNVVNACVYRNVKSLYVASSSEVYGEPEVVPTPENVPLKVADPRNPRFSYAVSKIASEMLALHAPLSRVIVFRPHNIYGPAMGNDHVIPELSYRLQEVALGKTLKVYGSPHATRSFCHIDDCVRALLLLREKGQHREIYNIGSSYAIRLKDLATELCILAGAGVNPEFLPAPDGSPLYRCPDISKLRALGYEPQVDFLDGLRKTVEWYRQQHDHKGPPP